MSHLQQSSGEELSSVEFSTESSSDNMSVEGNLTSKESNNDEKPYTYHDKVPYKVLMTFLYVLIAFGSGCCIATVSISLTELHKYLSEYQSIELKDVRLYVLLFQGIGIVVGSAVIGPFYDYSKNSTRWYHVNVNHIAGFFSLAFFSICFLIVPVITYAPITLFVNFFMGIGIGCVMVGSATIPTAVWKSERKSAAAIQSLLFALSIGGASCSLVIGNTIKTYDDWSPRKKIFVSYYLVNSVLLIPSILLGLIPPPRFDRTEIRRSKNNENEENFPQKMISFFSNLRRLDPVRVLFVLALGACFFSNSSVVDCLADMCTSYCEARGWSGVHAAYITSIFLASFTLSRLLGIFLFLFIKSTILLTFYFFSTMIVLILMFIFRKFDLAIWIGIGVVGLLLSPCFAGLATVPQSFGFELSAIEIGLIMMPNGFSEGVAGFEGFLMTIENDFFFFVSIFFSVLTVILFVFTMILGHFLRKRNEKK